MSAHAQCDHLYRSAGSDAVDDLEQHVSNCPDCTETITDHRWIIELIETMDPRDLDPPLAPLHGWEERLLARIDQKFPAAQNDNAKVEGTRMSTRAPSAGGGIATTAIRISAQDDVNVQPYIRSIGRTVAPIAIAAAFALLYVVKEFSWNHHEPSPVPMGSIVPPPAVASAPPQVTSPSRDVFLSIPASSIVPPSPRKAPPTCRTNVPADELQGVVASNMGFLRRCWEKGIGNEWADESHVTIRLEVAPDGHVTNSQAIGDAPSSVRECISVRAKQWKFPNSCSGAKIDVPLRLNVRAPATPKPSGSE